MMGNVVGRLGPIALAVPEHSIDQHEGHALLERCGRLTGDDARLSRSVHLKSGIERRGSVLLGGAAGSGDARFDGIYPPPRDVGDLGPTTESRMRQFEAHAVPLALRAARAAMSGMACESLTHVITVSCTGMMAPGVDIGLIAGLGLPLSVHRTHIGFMGCHGAIVALRTADDAVRAAVARGERAAVLVVCVELCTLHMPYLPRRDQIVAAALFADGAAAVVMSSHGVDGPVVRSAASRLIPATADLMRWSIGDHGFEMTLGERVPEIVARHSAEIVAAMIASAMPPIDRGRLRYAIHPGGPRVLTAVAEALHLAPEAIEASRRVLRDHGNMSSVTALAVAGELLRVSPADPLVVLGVGPGLTVEGVVLG